MQVNQHSDWVYWIWWNAHFICSIHACLQRSNYLKTKIPPINIETNISERQFVILKIEEQLLECGNIGVDVKSIRLFAKSALEMY